MFSKLFTGFLILLVIAAAILAFQEELLTNGTSYDMFVAVFDTFPFARETAEIAANIGQYGTTMQGLSPSNFLGDLTKVFAMAVVCPMVISIACRVILPLPSSGDWQAQERYMNSIGYRLKECLLYVVMLPACAWLTAKLMDLVRIWLQSQMPWLHSFLIDLSLLAAFFGASTLIQMVESPKYMGLILGHRVIVDLLGGVLKILGLNVLCFFMALALLNDQNHLVLGYVLLLMLYLTAIEWMLNAILGKFS